MQIERLEEMRLTPADELAIGTLLDAAFNSEFEGRSYFQQRHHVRFILRDGAQVLGHIALSLRAIRMGDRLVNAAGVAEVATHPDHRGKGIASRLMEAVIAEARQSVAGFLVLFGDELLYAGVGFETKTNHVLAVSMHGVRTNQIDQWKAAKLMVMALSDIPWDDTADIDLVGFAF